MYCSDPFSHRHFIAMLPVFGRIYRNLWNAGERYTLCHLRFLHDLADKAMSSCSSSSDLTVSYLMNSCGLSQTAALSAADRINLKTIENADSVLALFRTHGLTTSNIASIITKSPRLLFSHPESNIKPKLEFFLSVGVSNDGLVKLITAVPSILNSSLEKTIKPNFDKLKNICGSDKELLGNTRRFVELLQRNFDKEIYPNLKTLRDHGVPPSSIVRLSIMAPQVLLRNPPQFSKSVVLLKEMGIDPSKSYFALGLKAIWVLSTQTWKRRFQLYQNLGWSADETISAFKKFPICMIMSDEKIMRTFDFFVKRLNWLPSFVARNPVLLGYSLENTVIPRHNVMKILASKGLETKNLSMATIIRFSEKNFLDKYVLKYKDQAPEVLEAYKDKLLTSINSQ